MQNAARERGTLLVYIYANGVYGLPGFRIGFNQRLHWFVPTQQQRIIQTKSCFMTGPQLLIHGDVRGAHGSDVKAGKQ